MSSEVYIAGELESWPTMSEMATLLRDSSVAVSEGRYSLRLTDFDHFVFQRYGGDLGHPDVDFEAGTLDDMLRDAGRISQVLGGAGLRHRFEIYNDSGELVGYLHYDWPQESVD
jgi:hypothetical protein